MADPFIELEETVRLHNAPRHSSAFGIVGRLLVYATFFVGWLLAMPSDDILGKPLASVTIGSILGLAAWVFVGFAWVKYLFTPSQSERAQQAWNTIGRFLVATALVGALIGGAIYLKSHQ
jgi:hypothetical protein